MNIFELTEGIADKRILGANVDVKGLAHDSRAVGEGYCFFCLPGTRFDGHAFAGNALKAGAVAFVTEREIDLPDTVAQVIVPDSRTAYALMSANFYGNPGRKLKLIGVTGTNGKTTTTHMIKAILEQAGHKVGMLGTIANYIGDRILPQQLTTPDPVEFHALLAEMLYENCDVVVMEVSAHALDLRKLEGVRFDVAVFTNFTQDHLDYFKTMENYYQAKAKLFRRGVSKRAVVNLDDEAAVRMMRENDIPYLGFSLKGAGDIGADNLRLGTNGMEMELLLPGTSFDMSLKLPGRFNAYNAMAAAGACSTIGIKPEDIKAGLEGMAPVSGRFELLDAPGKPYTVVLDYAHAPDGLQNILVTAKELTKNRLICVFGCGGDRDREKRPIMGEIAGKTASFTVITSDNPRSEEPMDIINSIKEGIEKTDGPHICIEDRTEAIYYALDMAGEGDIVVIAGKGHEAYQDIKGVKHPYSDKAVVEKYMKEKG